MIRTINIQYCMVAWSDFPDFICWFFGDWQVRGTKREHRVDGEAMGKHLGVRLLFAEWHEEEIMIARRTMEECGVREDGVWQPSGVWESVNKADFAVPHQLSHDYSQLYLRAVLHSSTAPYNVAFLSRSSGRNYHVLEHQDRNIDR
ncbi:hypothetical protein BT69DRAFT_1339022 [Atractiella rhizophila]|nr:hypothetical protein BT69DRAFT_1339022 [Atractiella rhizophila]